jgi:hypothetical protein
VLNCEALLTFCHGSHGSRLSNKSSASQPKINRAAKLFTPLLGILPRDYQTEERTADAVFVAITNYRRSVRRSLCCLANNLDGLEYLECMAKTESP